MKIDDFNALLPSEKFQYLNLEGIVVGERRNGSCRFHLFQMDTFYVELGYDFIADKLVYMTVFDSMDYLDPYLAKINIQSLLKA